MLGAVALGGVTYALIAAEATSRGTDVVVSAAVGLAAGVAFVVRERQASDPMLPLGCSPTGSSAGPIWRPSAVYGALGGSGLFLMLQLQNVLGYGATAAGAATLPSILLITLLSPRVGRWPTGSGPACP